MTDDKTIADDKTRLIFMTLKKIWLRRDVGKWTIDAPPSDYNYEMYGPVGSIDTGSFLIFSHMYEDAFNFYVIKSGSKSILDTYEFLESDIKHLTDPGINALTLKDDIIKDTTEMSVISNKYALLKDTRGWTFNLPIYLLKDTYIVMTEKEYKQSNGRLGVGEKISLRHLLDVYSTATGQNLILK